MGTLLLFSKNFQHPPIWLNTYALYVGQRVHTVQFMKWTIKVPSPILFHSYLSYHSCVPKLRKTVIFRHTYNNSIWAGWKRGGGFLLFYLFMNIFPQLPRSCQVCRFAELQNLFRNSERTHMRTYTHRSIAGE